MAEKKKRIQMAFDIDEELKKSIKVAAAKRGITMNMLVHRAIVKYLDQVER